MTSSSEGFGNHLKPREVDIRQGLFFLIGGAALVALGVTLEA